MNEKYLERGMLITGNFEGHDPWANITGNFDGEGLTCGQLGKTIRAGDQQAVVKGYLSAHGEAELRQLMPKTGREYLSAVTAGVSKGMQIVIPWSGTSSTVKQPYNGELAGFWKSAKMVDQQRTHASEHEGKLTQEWLADWKGSGSFQEFALFFDIAAQNGSMKGVNRATVNSYIGNDLGGALKKALDWVAAAPNIAAGYKDSQKNADLWGDILKTAAVFVRRLFILAFLRAQKATERFQWDVINRKGALAFGEGWIHGDKWNFTDDFALAGTGIVPVIERPRSKKPIAPRRPSDAPPESGILYRVAAHSGLRLRSTPSRVNARNIIDAYPQGTLVRFIEKSTEPGWWRVVVDQGGDSATGYVAAEWLTPVASTSPPVARAATPTPAPVLSPTASGVVAVHFPIPKGKIVKRSDSDGRIWPLNERPAPTRKAKRPAGKANDLGKIIKWLKVDGFARYLPQNAMTFCNIYAYDYCCLAGCYLPRVWWTQKAIQQLSNGQTVEIKYEDTVDEWTANMLYQWFRDWGKQFGWRATSSLDDLQSNANSGGVSIIVAKNSQGHGHITAVVPEVGTFAAARDAKGTVLRPLESQAGTNNYQYVTKPSRWWMDPRYSFGFWIHA
jgi:hypothetical protein